MKRHIRVSVALACAMLVLPMSAWAQGLCNAFDPNSQVVGAVSGPMGVPIPICTQAQAQEGDESSQVPEPDGTSAAAASASEYGQALSRLVGATVENARALAANPAYDRFSKGEWKYFHDPATATMAAGCTAIFANLDGMLTLSSRGGADRPVMARFVGRQVPAPSEMEKVTIGLRDSGKPPQSMAALNLADPLTGMGAVAISIKDLPAALSAFNAAGDIAIDLDGKRVYALKYHDGAQMKERFASCARGEQ